MNETTHCIFCDTKLKKFRCPNKKCKYDYCSRSDSPYYRSFWIDDIWYHYEPNGMRIYSRNSGISIDLDRHLTLEQINNFKILL